MVSQHEVEDSRGEVAIIHGVSPDETSLIIRLKNSQFVLVPIELLQIKDSDRYYLSQSFTGLSSQNGDDSSEKPDVASGDRTFSVVEERPVIRTKEVQTAQIKIKKAVKEMPETIERSLAKEEFLIERVPKNDIQTEPAQMRIEGDLTIIPVQEEILVVEKRILLKEEIRIRKMRTEHNEKVTVNLKKEEVTIEKKKLN